MGLFAMPSCDFIGGWMSGMIGLTVGFPFDTIKVVQQTSGIKTTECMKSIYRQGGLRGFFRGLGFPLIASGVGNSFFFAIYGVTLQHIINLRDFKWYDLNDEWKIHNSADLKKLHISHYDFFLAGSIGGFASVAVGAPVELIKIKLQIAKDQLPTFPKQKPLGPIGFLKNIISTEGLRGLYRGWGAMALRDVPSSGVYMMIYEVCSRRTKIWSEDKDRFSHLVGLFLSGGVAGTASWWSVMPMDTIKSQLQGDSPTNPKYHGLMDCARKTVREFGVKGLFRGFWAVTLRGFPSNGAAFLAFEHFFHECHRTKQKLVSLESANSSTESKSK